MNGYSSALVCWSKVRYLLFRFGLVCLVISGCFVSSLASSDPSDPGCVDPNGESCWIQSNDVHGAFPHAPFLILLMTAITLFIFVRIIIRLWDLIFI